MHSAEHTSGAVAAEIRNTLRALLSSRRTFETNGGSIRRFTDDDEQGGIEGTHGSYASMQGLRTVFGSLIALPDEATWQLVMPDLSSLLEEWASVLSSPDVLTSCRPYDLEPVYKKLLRKETAYTDAAAWAVSSAVTANFLWNEFEHRLNRPPGSRDAMLRFLGDALEALLTLQATDGGWNWRSESETGHLYFTWTALQGLADYYDYVDGESREDIDIGRDDFTFAVLAARGLTKERIDAARARAATFLDPLARKAFRGEWSAKDLILSTADETIVVDDDPDNPVPDCYLLAYLQESLILSAYDATGEQRQTVDRLHDILKAQYKVGRAWLANRKAEGATDVALADLGTLHLTVTTRTRRDERSFKLQDPSLWPQLLRTFVLYTYYVSRTPVMDEAIIGTEGVYGSLMADRIVEGPRRGLWDTTVFNLAITCRGVEGLIDVCDEVARLEKLNAGDLRAPTDLAAMIAAAVYPWIAKRLEKPSVEHALAPTPIHEESAHAVAGASIEAISEDILSWARKPLQQRSNDPHRTTLLSRSDLGRADLDFVAGVLGGPDAKSFEEGSPVAHALFRAIAAVSIATTARLLPRILESALLNHASDPLLKSRFPENGPEDQVRRALQDRLEEFYESVAGTSRVSPTAAKGATAKATR